MSKKANPNEINLSNASIKLKFNAKGVASALVRTAFDIAKGSPSGATTAEWIKALGLKTPKEKQAFTLITNALIDAFQKQLKIRIDQTDIDENKNLVTNEKVLQFDIFSKLGEGEYIFDCAYLKNPKGLPFLDDFKPIYREWLLKSFPISEEHANLMIADFPDIFAGKFYNCLKDKSKYAALLDWCSDSMTAEWAKEIARQDYKIKLKEYYQQPALGEQQVALADVYVQPSFLVFDKIFSEKKQKEIKQKDNVGSQKHFLPTDFKGSIHDYLKYHFLGEKKSKAINSEEEKSRMLILMGQPGHGKSSFCYRSMHDLLRSPGFNGNTFFIRLQEVDKAFINTPFSEIQKELKQHIDFEECMQPEFKHQKNILFLDGLDEMYMTKSLTDSDVILMINNCKKLLNKHPNLYIVITSRFNYVETSKLYNNDCLLFSLGTLSEEQQKELVGKFTKRTPNSPCNLDEATLKRCNEKNELKFIKELIELPILLQMILISDVDVQNTQSRAAIYEQLFETVIERKWDKDKRLKKYQAQNFKPKHLRAYISLLAYEIYKRNKGYLNKSDVEALDETKNFKEKYLTVAHEGEGLKDVLKDILTSFYLKEALKDNDKNQKDSAYDYAIEFLHKSLYEYLACEHIWKEIKKFFLAKEGYEDDEPEYKNYPTTDVLRKIQRVFAHVRLNGELMGYLQEIIDNDTEKHDELVERMSKYLPDLLKHGFIYEYKQTETLVIPTYRPEQQVINCFHGFWTIYGQLNAQKINWPNYDLPWIDFEKKYLDTIDKTEILTAYQDDIIWLIEKLNMSSNTNKSIEEQLQNESEIFGKWLRAPINADEKTIAKFQYWTKRYAYLKRTKTIHSNKIIKCEGEKERITHFLRLTSAEKLNMNLNCAFMKLSNTRLSSLMAIQTNFEGADLNLASLGNAYLCFSNLCNADLRSANLSKADLFKTKLRNADLRNADLSYAYLFQTDLRNADLRNVNLRNASLCGAKFINADLHFANLSNADISLADLSNANLRNADLRNADLSFADLRNTDFRNTDLRNVNLRNARILSEDWIRQLASKDVKGLDYIEANYIVSQHKEEFESFYGNATYEAYEILEQE